ncbi:hypothetical protein LINPERPRIM_LOCUS31740 [Linum perenne]
MGLSYS